MSKLDKKRLNVETKISNNRFSILMVEILKDINDVTMGQGSTKLWSKTVKGGEAIRALQEWLVVRVKPFSILTRKPIPNVTTMRVIMEMTTKM